MKYLNLLVKPASSLCNLKCKYCFYEDEASNRTLHSMGIMREDLAETLIMQAVEAAGPDGTINFAFQGGEPTMAGLAFFEHFAGMVHAYQTSGVNVTFSIQTNGTLITDEWARFLKRERFLVGLSLDGFRDTHDAHRVDANGHGTWRKVLTAKGLLEKHGVDYNALCVVTKHCAAHPERAYNTLKQLGFRYIQFIACLDPIGHKRGCEPWSLAPDAYGRFLCRVFDLWYQDWISGNYHSVRLFEDYVHILLGDGASACSTCGKCGAYLVIEADGSGYPCDFYALDDWKIGMIHQTTLEQMHNSIIAAEFLQSGVKKPEECASCPYGRICNGGCKNDWFVDDNGTHNYYCPAFRMFLDYAFPRIHQIATAELHARHK